MANINGVSASGNTNYGDWDPDEGVCYATSQPAPAKPSEPGIDGCAPGNSDGVCLDSADIYDPYAAEPEPWNSGKGPTLQLDPAYAGKLSDKCQKTVQETYLRCVETKTKSAEKMCAPSHLGPGRGVDNRPVTPGQEQACVDGWVYGTDGQQVQVGRSESGSYSKATTKGEQTQSGGKVSLKVPIFGGIGVEGSRQTTESRSETETRGITDGRSRTESISSRPREGRAESCQETYRRDMEPCEHILRP